MLLQPCLERLTNGRGCACLASDPLREEVEWQPDWKTLTPSFGNSPPLRLITQQIKNQIPEERAFPSPWIANDHL